jgi:hypothetical protein
MPNWSWNQLYLHGDIDELLKFHRENTNTNGYLDFELSIPTDNPIDLWGTKWNAIQNDYPENYEVVTLPSDDNDNRLEFEFKTAWNPPFNYVKNVSKIYPNIEFELSSDRYDICYENGEITDEVLYSDTDDEDSS